MTDDYAQARTLTEEALRETISQPSTALPKAIRRIRAAAADENKAELAAARLVAGVSYLQLGRIDGAVTQLRGASFLAHDITWTWLRGRARMSLASALSLRGRTADALATIDAALADLEGTHQIKAKIQRAAILMQLDKPDEALSALDDALANTGEEMDSVDRIQALSNRSIILVAKRSFGEAEDGLLLAAELADANGFSLVAAMVEQNLADLLATRGDVPQALHRFHRAEELWEPHVLDEPTLYLDRARLLLSVRLLQEAKADADRATRAATKQRRWVSFPEAQLLSSTIAALQGDYQDAAKSAAKAERSFKRMGRTQILPLARYARFQALRAQGSRAASAHRAREIARQLEQTGWPVPAVEARLAAGRIELHRGKPEQAKTDLEKAAQARHDGPADARATAWLAEALAREADGRRRAAYLALEAGLRVLENHRAAIGASELRARVSVHRGAIARHGLTMSLSDRNATAVHRWAERGRATALALRPVRPPDDETLGWYLEDLRATVVEIDQARDEGKPTTDLLAHQQEVEMMIRDHVRRSPGRAGATPVPRPGEVTERLGEDALVELIEHEGLLYAVTAVAGRWRMHELGPTERILHPAKHLPFALTRMARADAPAASTSAALSVVDRHGRTVDAVLLQPLKPYLEERHVVLVPPVRFQSLPWFVLPTLREREVTLAPSATLWHAASGRPEPANGGYAVVAGPGLPGAEGEAEAVAALYPGARLLTSARASAPAVAELLDGAAVAHIAAHGRLRTDQPLFSSFQLYDGPFTVYDIERLAEAPDHVVLASCETARTQVIGGQEILGLTAALLNRGTRTLIAPVVAIPDADTAPVMTAYHQGLIAGHAASSALRRALGQAWDSGEPGLMATACAFACLGSGQ